MNYSDLVASIRSYTEVDSNALPDAVINTFIMLTENKILRDVDLDVFKKEVTGNLTPNNRFLSTPADILTHRYLMVRDPDGNQIFLEFRDTSFMKEYWADSSVTGLPKYYSVWDEDTFYVAPTPDSNYTAQLGYIYRPEQLSTTNPTTWISKNIPEALLYGCLVQAYSFTKGPEGMLAYFDNAYKEAIQTIGIEQQGRRRRDEHRDGMIRLPLQSLSPGP
jgi:hypothetical protein